MSEALRAHCVGPWGPQQLCEETLELGQPLRTHGHHLSKRGRSGYTNRPLKTTSITCTKGASPRKGVWVTLPTAPLLLVEWGPAHRPTWVPAMLWEDAVGTGAMKGVNELSEH